jgi:hypothetical protein
MRLLAPAEITEITLRRTGAADDSQEAPAAL